MRSASLPLLLLTLIGLGACGDTAPTPTGRVSSAILGGRPSGEDENAAVYIETASPLDPSNPLRCSGRIIAPSLVVTARHCLLERRSQEVFCNADGSPTDPTQAGNVTIVKPEVVTVFIGTEKSTARKVGAKEIFTEGGVTLCSADIAYVLLAETGLDTRTPIRKTAPRLIDTVSITGWGQTTDAKVLPATRSTIERPITQTGPNGIPGDTFAIAGNSVCRGDSGASALREGALLGVYSRIDYPDQCSLEANRNIFVWPGAHLELADVAFAAIGEKPWFEGQARPWLAQAGAACTTDEECSSTICDKTTSTCAAACNDDGFACPAGRICNAEKACVDPTPAPPPPAPTSPPEDDGGCTTSRAKANLASPLLIAAAVVACSLRRRRSITGA